MDKHNPATPDGERNPSYVLPQWDIPRRRLLLDRRVRSVRRVLLAGGIIGAVAFSALAGYGTKVVSGAGSGAKTAAPVSATQTTGSGFFSGQSNSGLGSSSASGTSQAPTRTQSS